MDRCISSTLPGRLGKGLGMKVRFFNLHFIVDPYKFSLKELDRVLKDDKICKICRDFKLNTWLFTCMVDKGEIGDES